MKGCVATSIFFPPRKTFIYWRTQIDLGLHDRPKIRLFQCKGPFGMTEQVGGNPVLTTYLPHFGHEADGPTLITFQDFEPHGWSVSSEGRPPGGLGHKPVRARFVAAGLLFAPGRFVQDVPYDPLLLYAAEEPALAVHAFTHGYDLHHPYQHVCVHRYEREDPRYRHYHQDRCPETILRQEAVERQRIQSLLGAGPQIPLGNYGLGTARSLADYGRYAALDFRTARCHAPSAGDRGH